MEAENSTELSGDAGSAAGSGVCGLTNQNRVFWGGVWGGGGVGVVGWGGGVGGGGGGGGGGA